MTKGRKFAPSSANEGIWFRHRGEPGDVEGKFRDVTSTRAMLSVPFSAPPVPRSPPAPFKDKDEGHYKSGNPFTQHDNRHYFQEYGEYLGNGKDTRTLGRRLHPVDRRLHHTAESFLHHRSRNPILHDYNSITSVSYTKPGLAEPVTRRRFPKIYKQSESSEQLTSTTAWLNSPFRTPMHVLAVSQEPFLPHNRWKYSYHGDHKVYPPYDRKKSPAVSNVLDRYGSDFAALPNVGSTD